MRTHQPSSRAEQDSDDIRESTSTVNPVGYLRRPDLPEITSSDYLNGVK